MKIARNRIRFLYYSGSLCLVLVLLVSLGGSYLYSYAAQTRDKIRQFSESILETNKKYVKDAIDLTVQEIDIERDRLTDSEKARLGRVWDRIDAALARGGDTAGFVKRVREGKMVSDGIDALCLERDSGRLYSLTDWTALPRGIGGVDSFRDLADRYRLTMLSETDLFLVLLGISGEYIEAAVRENVIYRIRRERLADDGYIWIHQIVDYDGGERYAICLVHPNLPDEEGSFLSTETPDIRGNKPYLTELEGVKKDGELYFDYWVNKLDSDVIAHKLSYAALYKPYDWVIGTGVYLDDLDALRDREAKALGRTQRAYLFLFCGLGVLALALSLALIMFFERRMEVLIGGLQAEVTDKNRQLENEKKRIEEIAYLDPLTGLLNRRAMLAQIEQSSARVLRHEGTFSIALADIDYFKRVNDEYGHVAGDLVLTALSSALRSRMREEDSLSRWGGEEFLFLLHNAEEDEAAVGIERLRETVEALGVSFEGRSIRITMSFGVASWTDDIRTVDDLIKRADNRLYEAKERGRNRVVARP